MQRITRFYLIRAMPLSAVAAAAAILGVDRADAADVPKAFVVCYGRQLANNDNCASVTAAAVIFGRLGQDQTATNAVPSSPHPQIRVASNPSVQNNAFDVDAPLVVSYRYDSGQTTAQRDAGTSDGPGVGTTYTPGSIIGQALDRDQAQIDQNKSVGDNISSIRLSVRDFTARLSSSYVESASHALDRVDILKAKAQELLKRADKATAALTSAGQSLRDAIRPLVSTGAAIEDQLVSLGTLVLRDSALEQATRNALRDLPIRAIGPSLNNVLGGLRVSASSAESLDRELQNEVTRNARTIATNDQQRSALTDGLYALKLAAKYKNQATLAELLLQQAKSDRYYVEGKLTGQQAVLIDSAGHTSLRPADTPVAGAVSFAALSRRAEGMRAELSLRCDVLQVQRGSQSYGQVSTARDLLAKSDAELPVDPGAAARDLRRANSLINRLTDSSVSALGASVPFWGDTAKALAAAKAIPAGAPDVISLTTNVLNLIDFTLKSRKISNASDVSDVIDALASPDLAAFAGTFNKATESLKSEEGSLSLRLTAPTLLLYASEDARQASAASISQEITELSDLHDYYALRLSQLTAMHNNSDALANSLSKREEGLESEQMLWLLTIETKSLGGSGSSIGAAENLRGVEGAARSYGDESARLEDMYRKGLDQTDVYLSAWTLVQPMSQGAIFLQRILEAMSTAAKTQQQIDPGKH